MRFLRILLWLVALAAAGIWFLGLAHGFRGFTCVQTGHTCKAHDLRLRGHLVVWVAPLALIASLWLVRISKGYTFRFQQYTKRPAPQRESLRQPAAQLVPPTVPSLSDDPVSGARVSSDRPVSQQVERTPRHAAKGQFMTLDEPSSKSRPRHAAPEPEPEW
jgi:hypothetical protein